MGLQPIDLQTMYSQVANVAREAQHLSQGLQLADSMHQADVVKENQEQAQKVQQTNENSKSALVNKDGKNSQNQENNPSKKRQGAQKNAEETPKENKSSPLKEDYLGQHVDITG